MRRNIKELVSQMTLEEKAGMCSGLDLWRLKGIRKKVRYSEYHG